MGLRESGDAVSATLEWALVDGSRVHAARFVGVESRLRPAATCPCCGSAVTWKAGESVTPHVAHLPDSTCPTSNPETAAHFNAKMRLADMLGERGTVSLVSPCTHGHPVSARWLVGRWTCAIPESRVGTRRPDVVLVSESDSGSDIAVAAIEVLHTHAVDAAKAADLAASGVPWIEVTSADALAWNGAAPLPTRNVDEETRGSLDAACRRCAALAYAARAEADRRASLAATVAADSAALREADQRARRERFAMVEYPREMKRREDDARRLLASPPPHHIAVAIAMVANPGETAVGAVLMKPGRPVRTCLIEGNVGSGTAAWIALEHAIGELARLAPGVSATFFTNYPDVAKGAMRPRYPLAIDDEGEALRRRVVKAVDRGGHLVLATPASRSVRFDAAEWILKAQTAARAALDSRVA